MDISPYMKKPGFSRRGSNHIIVEQDGKLWLAFASQGAATFMSSASQSSGVLEIGLYDGDKELSYEYTATESAITVKAETGTLKIAIDRDTNALIFEASGVSLRLDAKDSPQNATSLNTPEGVELTIGGGRYFFKTTRGAYEFDDTWLLTQFHSATPVLKVTPTDGALTLAAYDLPPETQLVETAKTVDACAVENEAEFNAFCEELTAIPGEWGDVREKIAYLLWIGHKVSPKDGELILGNKLRSNTTESFLLAIASLAFKDAEKCVNLISALPVSPPPVHGYAVMRLFSDGLFKNLSRGTVIKLYKNLGEAARYWCSDRASLAPDLSFYGYRFETGVKAPKVFTAGEPVASPDLSAYLVLISEALSKIAEFLYDGGEAINWREKARAQTAALLGNLWDGETFTGMNIYTREKSEKDAVLSFIPMLLGARLPSDVTKKLAENFDSADAQSALGALAVLGMFESGQIEKAKEITLELLKKAREDNVKCPYYGAALLALASKTLN